MLDSVTDLIFESVYPGADSHGLPVDAVVITPGLSKRLIQPTLQLLKHKEVERVTINIMVVRRDVRGISKLGKLATERRKWFCNAGPTFGGLNLDARTN